MSDGRLKLVWSTFATQMVLQAAKGATDIQKTLSHTLLDLAALQFVSDGERVAELIADFIIGHTAE
jgi:hypothetical protein